MNVRAFLLSTTGMKTVHRCIALAMAAPLLAVALQGAFLNGYGIAQSDDQLRLSPVPPSLSIEPGTGFKRVWLGRGVIEGSTSAGSMTAAFIEQMTDTGSSAGAPRGRLATDPWPEFTLVRDVPDPARDEGLEPLWFSVDLSR